MSITVIMPSRGRPEAALAVSGTFRSTARHATSAMALALDLNDPRAWDYMVKSPAYHLTGNMVQRTNELAVQEAHHADIIGWCADDNRFITPGWDCAVERAFDQGALMVNTNDLLVENEKGGVVFMRSDVVRALGYFFLPTLEHLYADYAFTELGKRAGVLEYLPDVIIEHQHPLANKAQWDDQYRSYNNSDQDARDRAAFYQWYEGEGLQRDVEIVRDVSARRDWAPAHGWSRDSPWSPVS